MTPDELLRRYEALLIDVPAENVRLHLCLRADGGIIIADTCPSRDAFEGFVAGTMRDLSARHELPEPERVEDFLVSGRLGGCAVYMLAL